MSELARAVDVPTEEVVAAIVSDLLEVDSVDVTADFFELGGHSLLAVRVVERLAERTGVALELESFFDLGTVRAVAAELDRRRSSTSAPVEIAPSWTDAGGERRGPLTRSQQTVWATNHFLGDGTYNLYGALRLSGPLDREALSAALEDVHRRHPSLRTVFPLERGEPRQHVLAEAPVPLAVRDLTHLPPESALEECLRECRARAELQLPLETVPPVRVQLHRIGSDDHVLFVVLHHVIADGASVPILIEDLARCYNARLGDRPAAPREHDVDMLDYARWEEDRLRNGDLDAARRYWRETLDGATFGALPLPPPLARERAERRAGAFAAAVDAPTSAAVRALAAEGRASVFVVVAAAMASMLARYTGREDLVVGMPIARRERPGFEDCVGLLVDMAPIRIDVGGNPTFAELVRRTRKAVLGATTNAFAAAEVAGAGAAQDPFDVVLTDAGRELPPPPFHGLDARQLDLPAVGAKFDLNFLVRETREALAIDVEFERRAVSEDAVAAMTSTVATILAEGAADPRRPSLDLAAAPFGEPAGGAIAAPRAHAPRPGESLVTRLAEVAEARGDAVAVSAGGATLSYGELVDAADRVARGLRAQGVGQGSVVAAALPRGADLLVALLGIMGCGAAYLVVDGTWPRARAARVLADAGARLVIASEADPSGEQTTVARLAELGTTAPTVAPPPCDGTAYVMYTSGSTGSPKGVHISHRNVLSLLDATADRFGFDASDTWTLFHSCAFDFSVWEVFGCLLHGGRLVVVPDWTAREPEAFVDLLRGEGVTVLSLTPSALGVMLPALAAAPGAARTVRYLVCGGEALERRLVDRWYETVGTSAQVVNMYGITETTVHASWRWLSPDDADTAESDIGEALPGGALHLLHDNGTSVRDCCVGEIYVGGSGVGGGYPGRARETAMRFVPDPFSSVPGARLYRSGDLGRRRGTRISYLGRRDRQVQVGGFRVELPEVESALSAEPGVAAAAAATVRDEAGPRIVAVVVAEGRTPLAPADVLRAARATLPTYMVPSSIAVVDELPLTVNGKVDREAVAAAAARAPAAAPPMAAPPSTEAEAVLLELFREVLHDDAVSTAADFFDHGGDSLRAIRLVGMARDRGLRLTVGDVYAAPSLTELAARAGRTDAATGDPPAGRAPFSLLDGGVPRSLPAGVEDAYPMTALQVGMLYHQEIAPGSDVYHIVLSYRLRGPMEPDAFRQAVQVVTDAHPVLRTSFEVAHAEGPMQLVHARVEAPVEFEDLRHLDPAARADRVERVVAAELAGEIDLTRPPAFRFVILVLSDDEYQLVFNHHHVILDGWSVNILFEDLHAHYGALLDGRRPRPAALRTTFADYVAHEQRAIANPASRRFWLTRSSPPAPLLAPEANAPPAMRQLRTEYPAGTLAELRSVATKVGVPVKALLLAVHVRVLAWMTGSDEVVTGLIVTCRPEQPDSDRALGLFLNELPSRIDVGDLTWGELAREVHLDERAMLEHRWYPHARIQRDHGARRIYDSYFNFTDFHTTQRLLRNASLDLLDVDEIESTHHAFGANYTVDVRTSELRLILEYDAAALDRSAVALAAEGHRRALNALLADADASCRRTPLPGVVDQMRLLAQMEGPSEPAAARRPAGAPRPDAAPARGAPGDRPRSAREQSVWETWVEVLGPGTYGVASGFFDAGGDSLTAMQVVSRLRAKHGALSMTAFMEAPTIEGVARALPATAPPAAESPVERRAARGPRRYPLSPTQHQLWELASQLPGLPLFGMPGALEASGPLDLDVLQRVLDVLVGRHEALRTRIEATDRGPEQVVEPDVRLEAEHVDLSAHPDPAGACERLIAAAVREPLALDRAPLARATVYRLGEDRNVLYLNIHHMVCDGWSMALLLREMAETYRELALGTAPIGSGVALGSGEVTLARTEWARSPAADDQRRYWLDRLAPPWRSLAAPPASRLPSTAQAELTERFRFANCRRRLEPAAAEAVRQAARSNGLTEFMVVMTGLASALSAWSGEEDVRIATMVANRTDPRTEEVVGLLANTLVLRLDAQPGADLAELSQRTRRACIEAYDNQELPFEDVLASLEHRFPPGERAGPLFEVMLLLQEDQREVAADELLTLGRYQPRRDVLSAPVTPTAFELLLAATSGASGILLDLQYKPVAMTEATASDLLADIEARVVATARALGGTP